MTFAIFVPATQTVTQTSATTLLPTLYYLSGLTCTDENVAQKGGAFGACARRGLAMVMPDTSPRGLGIAGEDDGWDFGTGAGFYVNAVTPKWANVRCASCAA